MTRRVWSSIPGYLFALAANLVALGLTYALEPIIVPSPFPIFVAATALSTWFYGVGVGLVSTVLAILVTNYFFLPPIHLLTLGKEDVPRLGVFLLVTAITVSLMRLQRVATETRARLGAIVAFSDDAMIGLNLDGTIASWNAGAQRIYGYSFPEVRGHSILRIVPAERERQAEMEAILARIRAGEMTQEHETLHQRKSGQRLDASITISPIRDDRGEINGASLIARDITDRKQAQKALEETTAQLHYLSRRLVEVQENERRLIARELHDEIGQDLTGLQLIMEVLPSLPPETIREKTRQAQTLVSELFERVSRLTLDLRPPMLDDLGLLPTLLWHFNRYTALTNVQIYFAHSGLEKRRFASDLETAAYRIIQEALTNVARHASANQIEVRVAVAADCLRIRIADNGQGFDFPTALASGKAGGLVGMRERAELLGGRLAIHSTPGQGAELEVELPLEEAEIPVDEASA